MSEPDNKFRVEPYATRSTDDEFLRAIMTDIPLVPFVFVIMSLFCCLIFGRRHKVRSQCILGVGAVFCVFLSITTGYGLMFVIGVPLTSLTQVSIIYKRLFENEMEYSNKSRMGL
jgi:hypothetical protein